MKTGFSNRIAIFCLLAAPASALSLSSYAQNQTPSISGIECSTVPTDELSRDTWIFKSDKPGAPWSLAECAGDGQSTNCRDAGLISAEAPKNQPDGSTQIKINCADCDGAFETAVISLPTEALNQQQMLIQGKLEQLSGEDSIGQQSMICRVQPGATAPAGEAKVACSASGSSQIIGDSSKTMLSVKNGEALRELGPAKQIKIGGKLTSLVAIELTSSKFQGWIAQSAVRTSVQCSLSTGLTLNEVTDARRQAARPKPKHAAKPAKNTAAVRNAKAPVAVSAAPVTCAQKMILQAAKKYERENYDDRPESGGTCAFGVNRELVSSHIGNITGGFGYGAVDFTRGLPSHGYVDTGLRDPATAPAGSVIVFAGPKSAQYLKTGEQEGSSAGTWAGHVTIKGDDGFYYTDGRTKAPAVGWNTASVNIAHVRNVIGIYVPGPTLVEQYANKCDN